MSDRIILRGRLNGTQQKRLKGLLDVEYTTTELASRVGFNRRQIYRVYRKMDGFPHRMENPKKMWINGAKFREWYFEMYGRGKHKLASDQAFCLTCRQGVKIVDPTQRHKNGIPYLESNCPNCGRKITRIISDKKK
jgi:hypothetical protein